MDRGWDGVKGVNAKRSGESFLVLMGRDAGEGDGEEEVMA